MNCTVCQYPMITLEMDGVETDYCPSCGGIWLDSGELELLLGSGPQAEQLVRSFQPCRGGKEAQRRCLICDRRMEKINAGRDDSPVVIDRCPKNHGLWFDQGELPAVLEKGCLDPENRVKQLLGNLYAPPPGSSSDQAENKNTDL